MVLSSGWEETPTYTEVSLEYGFPYAGFIFFSFVVSSGFVCIPKPDDHPK